jgi:hypothetical protein
LIREKNVFPVLQSILKLISGNSSSTSPKGNDDRSSGQGPAAKRRRVDGVPEGATDCDVPFPFMDGEGPQAEREKERGKQLIAQLVSLIKSAARKAATRTYQQQHVQHHRYQQPNWTTKQQDPEPKILGHYRPITATYGRSGAPIPEVLADQSNTSRDSIHTTPSPITPLYGELPAMQSFPSSQSDPVTQSSNPFDGILSSLFAESPAPSSGLGDDGQSISGWTGSTNTPSDASAPDFDQNAFESWMSIINAFPDPASNGERSGVSYGIDMLLSSISTNVPMHNNLTSHDHTPCDVIGDFTTTSANTNPDFAIDPVLLALSLPAAQTQSQESSLPPLTTSPIESVCTTADPTTPLADMSFPEPDVYVGEHGMSIEASQYLSLAQIMANQDPIVVASMPLHYASAPDSSFSPNGAKVPAPFVEQPPATVFDNSEHTMPQPAYNFFQRSLSPSSDANPQIQRHTASAPTRIFPSVPAPLRRLPTANKQEILARAKERRRQLVGEIDRAKVELWETTIEQGVLAQFVKEKL